MNLVEQSRNSHQSQNFHLKRLGRVTQMGTQRQNSKIYQLKQMALPILEKFPETDELHIQELLEYCRFDSSIVENLLTQELQTQKNENSQLQQQQVGSNVNRQKLKIIGAKKVNFKSNNEQQVQQQPQQQQQQQVQKQQVQEVQQQQQQILIQQQQQILLDQQQQQQQIQEKQQQLSYDRKIQIKQLIEQKNFLSQEDLLNYSNQLLNELQNNGTNYENQQNIIQTALTYVKDKITDVCVERNKQVYEENTVLREAFLACNKKKKTMEQYIVKEQEQKIQLKDENKKLQEEIQSLKMRLMMQQFQSQQIFYNNNDNNNNNSVF